MLRPILVTVGILFVLASSARGAGSLATMSDVELIQAYEAIHSGEAEHGVRCLFPMVAEMEIRGLPVQAMARATDDDPPFLVHDTPEGHFTIEYQLEGNSAVDPTDDDSSGVPDYVEWVGEAFEESYQREVVELGFDFPTGGRYLIRLRGFPAGTYGSTQPSEMDFGRSYILINSDFASFYATPPFDTYLNDDPDGEIRGAIRVTAAHEFKHTLQLYNRWTLSGETVGWFEVDATAMEDNVYDGINDYYNYLNDPRSPITEPDASFITYPLYDDAAWHHFLQARHGFQVIQQIDARRASFATGRFQFDYQAILEGFGDDFDAVWRDYAVANYLTGPRAVEGLGHEEAARYPAATVDTLATLQTTTPLLDELDSWSSRFYEFPNDSSAVVGELSFTFASPTPTGWTLAVVLQQIDGDTDVIAFELESTEQTFAVEGFDLANYDRIALIVGNARMTQVAQTQTYSVSFAFDPVKRAGVTSFGAFKKRY